MVLKVLLLNIAKEGIEVKSSGIVGFVDTIKSAPTLHDYHAIVMDINTIYNSVFWGPVINSNYLNTTQIVIGNIKEQVKEQVSTGGITFLFCGKEISLDLSFKSQDNRSLYGRVSNYFCSPMELGVMNEHGDTLRQE